MRKSTKRETEEELRKLLKTYKAPEFKPDFEKFKREYLDKATPPTEEDFRRIEEWNTQLRAARMQKVRQTVSLAACAVLAVAVVGGAIRMGRDSGVVSNPESGEVVSNASGAEDAVTSTTAAETVTTTTTTDLTWLEKNRKILKEARELTGLPLISAEDMDGFEGYEFSVESGQVVSIDYWFKNGIVYVYSSSINVPSLSNVQNFEYSNKMFLIQESVSDDDARVIVRYDAPSEVVYVGRFANISVEEAVQLLNSLVF